MIDRKKICINGIASALLSTGLFSQTTLATEPQIKIAQPGQNITLWDGWNVKATIYLKIEGGPGDDCIRLWWIKMGINSDPWKVCNKTQINVTLPLIYGELRAGQFQRQTAVAVSDTANAAYSFELCGRVIEC